MDALRPIALLCAGACLAPPTPARYAVEVRAICAGARMFDGAHEIGTLAGATDVAQDIRLTGRRRLDRVAALPRPETRRARVAAWLAIERRLVQLYAATYLRIWKAIDSAHTLQQRRRLPGVLRALVDRPRPFEARAAVLERELGLGDCTGGGGAGAPPAA